MEILALIAEGRSNAGVAKALTISKRTVEAACAQVFRKLDLEPSPDENRRVLAVLAFLRSVTPLQARNTFPSGRPVEPLHELVKSLTAWPNGISGQ
jgi:hypothetical protein